MGLLLRWRLVRTAGGWLPAVGIAPLKFGTWNPGVNLKPWRAILVRFTPSHLDRVETGSPLVVKMEASIYGEGSWRALGETEDDFKNFHREARINSSGEDKAKLIMSSHGRSSETYPCGGRRHLCLSQACRSGS